MNGVGGPDGDDYSPWADRKGAQPKSASAPQAKMSDSYSNTLPVRKSVTPKSSYAASKAPPAGHPRGDRAHACASVRRTLGPWRPHPEGLSAPSPVQSGGC